MKATTIYLAVAMGINAFAASANDASIATTTTKEDSMTNTASTPLMTTVRVR